uniref:NADH-ubiquinone oxidoreductase chain 2 n=1 Tax=Oecetis caucula TaxID=2904905 RepID=A0A9E8RSM8_9NEOP|nr:NADH dehydrogenase subunit 2 [Oecetis caucula]UZZ44208.1 NADH dehydrogenase subunit 2 [Oecetis caucula]
MSLKFNNFKLLIMTTLSMSIIMSLSFSSWLMMWLSMEINMMSFIPLMINFQHMKSSESMMLYYIIQSFSSMNFIFFMLLATLKMTWFQLNVSHLMSIINLVLLTKLGAAPFYFWLPQVMKELNWTTNFILLTWQKIIPMMLLNYCLSMSMLMISIVMSAVIGSLKGLNQTNLKTIMAFSSISHMSWLMAALSLNLNTWLFYFLNYFLLNFLMCKKFFILNLNSLNNLFMSNFNNQTKFILISNFFSMGGLPPFFGFFPKWMVITNLLNTSNFFITFILINSALMNIFFYLRIMTPMMLFSQPQFKFFNINKINSFKMNKYFYLTYFSNFCLIMITFLWN